jgi:hypothetical protein
LLGARSGEGEAPPRLERVQGGDGDSYNLLSGGTLEPAKPRLDEFVVSDGVLKINGFARSEDELRRMTKRKLAAHGLTFSRIESLVKEVRLPAPELYFELVFTQESHRAIAKMACNLFAAEHRELFMTRSFDAVRNFVANGEGAAGEFCTVNVKTTDISVHRKALGLLDHLVVVRSTGARIEALVTLFEHLQVVVYLGTVEEPVKVAVSQRVDQLGRKSRHNDLRDLRISVPSFERCRAASYGAWCNAVRCARARLLRVVLEEHRRVVQDKLIEDAYRETIGRLPPGEPIPDELLRRFAQLVCERWIEYLDRRGVLEQVIAAESRRLFGSAGA